MGPYTWIIVGTLVGFLALAFILLAPIYRFLDREEEASKAWTKQEVTRRQREHAPAGNGQRRPSEEEANPS